MLAPGLKDGSSLQEARFPRHASSRRIEEGAATTLEKDFEYLKAVAIADEHEASRKYRTLGQHFEAAGLKAIAKRFYRMSKDEARHEAAIHDILKQRREGKA